MVSASVVAGVGIFLIVAWGTSRFVVLVWGDDDGGGSSGGSRGRQSKGARDE